MIVYENSSRSGVKAYENRETSIVIEFHGGAKYSYTYESAGKSAVEEMKVLAEDGKKLCSYLRRHNPGYVKL